ncbi:hypothetical protein [Streptomyces sp. NPDC006289]|uniref:hypothetical protein n=1 Tax=Streptomyces sp. NPDC006289 TaxID=3156744 RepID=UPI0033B17A40
MVAVTPRSKAGRAVAAMAVVLVVLGGLFVGYGANAFGPDRLCRGWVSAADAERALPGGGRLTASEESTSTCTVERSGWWPWSEQRRLTITVMSEKSRYPFELSLWKVSGGSGVLVGPTAGSVDAWGGWAFLPQECTGEAPGTRSGERPTVRVSLSGAENLDGTAQLLATAARGVAKKSACGRANGSEPGAGALLRPSAVKDSDLGEVCGVPGFALPGLRGPDNTKVLEQTSGSFDSAWFCDLSFAHDEDNGPFTRIGVVKDPGLAAPLKDTGAERLMCAGEETFVVLDNVSYPWEPKERKAAGLPAEGELSDLFVARVRASPVCA